jgi:polar amino acid transport system substrate-binding protein
MKLIHRAKIFTIFLILILFLEFSLFGEERKPFVLAFPENFFSTDRQVKFIEDLREAFHRIGYEMIMEFYPGERCLWVADAGEVDGIPQRDGNLDDLYQNLIRVEVPLADVLFTAYTIKEDIQVDGWESMKDAPYRILYVDGVQCIKTNLESILPSEFIFAINNRESALKMLLAQRGDILIDREETLDSVISQNKVAYESIRKAGILGKEEQYIYLHKKHSPLVPELERILGGMKDENYFK